MLYTESEARSLVIQAGLKLIENKLIARTWGNISARISDTQFVITPSGRAYEDLTPDDLVTVNIADCSYEGSVKPSSEKGIHASCYSLRPEVNFIIHTHQFYASVISADGYNTDFAPCVPYALPGTDSLRKKVEDSVFSHPKSRSFLLERHGTVCLGTSFEDSFSIAESLETSSRKLFESRVLLSKIRPVVPSFPVPEEFLMVRDANIQEFCRRGIRLKAFLDDFAQLIGPDARLTENNEASVRKGLRRRNAVLVSAGYGICSGDNAGDREAASMILSKNAAAALYVRNGRPLPCLEAWLQRLIYLFKYSKIKDADQ